MNISEMPDAVNFVREFI